MIEALENFPDNVVAFSCKGQVTRQDYRTVLEPAVETALKGHEKVRLYYQFDRDFEGIDPGGVWEDFKIGIEHLSRWGRIAVVTDAEWISNTMKVFNFLVPAEMKVFPLDNAAEAREWIVAT